MISLSQYSHLSGLTHIIKHPNQQKTSLLTACKAASRDIGPVLLRNQELMLAPSQIF